MRLELLSDGAIIHQCELGFNWRFYYHGAWYGDCIKCEAPKGKEAIEDKLDELRPIVKKKIASVIQNIIKAKQKYGDS